MFKTNIFSAMFKAIYRLVFTCRGVSRARLSFEPSRTAADGAAVANGDAAGLATCGCAASWGLGAPRFDPPPRSTKGEGVGRLGKEEALAAWPPAGRNTNLPKHGTKVNETVNKNNVKAKPQFLKGKISAEIKCYVQFYPLTSGPFNKALKIKFSD